jgi:hypothetical protein
MNEAVVFAQQMTILDSAKLKIRAAANAGKSLAQ